LDAAHIPPRYAQPSALVEPNLTDPDGTLGKGTAVSARVATKAAVRKNVEQIALACFVREHLS